MKFSFSILLVMLCLNSRGQFSIINRSLTDSSVNVFYIGIENRIQVKGLRNDQQVIVKGAGSRIYKEEGDELIISVSTIDSCKITIANSSGKIIFKKTYRTDTLPHAVASLNGFFNTTLPKNKILINPFLLIMYPGSYFRGKAAVMSFNGIFITEIDSTVIQGYLNSFSEEQIKRTRQLRSGDKILFSCIRVSEANGRTTTVPDFWIRIE